MHFTPSTLAALTALLPLATADFRIYQGSGTGIVAPGAASSSSDLYILSNEPSCDDVVNYHSPLSQPADNDASSNGWACDGCTAADAPQDWVVDRLEFYNADDAVGASTDSPYPILDIATGSTSKSFQHSCP